MTAQTAISTNLQTLALLLKEAADTAKEAADAAMAGERNQAIGIVLDLEQSLPAAQALLGAALALHRLHH